MARRTKSEPVLTPEEKLANALVPVAEQPYPVPKNWCWTTISSVSEVVTGSTPSKKHPEYYGDDFPFFKPSDLDSGRNVYNASEYLSEEGKQVSRIIPAESSAVCCIGSIGKCGFLLREGTTNQQINTAIPKINPLYLYYYFQTESFVNELWSKASATTISIVNKSKMEQCFFPLAPIIEQQRIVDRIESLFGKLDEAKEKAQAVVDGFEDRKAAILHKAFTGELTEKWRQDNGIQKDTWVTVCLSDVCTINPPKLNTKELPDDIQVSFFPMPALSEITGTITAPQIRTLGNVRSGFTNFSEGDVVFAKITPCMENGKSAVIGPLINNIGFGTTEFYVFRCKDSLFNKYLWHLIRSQRFRNEAKGVMAGAVGQQRVPKGFLENYQVILPKIEEQKIIVNILDSTFEKEYEVVSAAEQVISQIGTMKISILAKAFRGELGTNDPNDENAEDLLKRIL